MVERNLQAVEVELEKMQGMLREVREALKAPQTNSNPFLPLK